MQVMPVSPDGSRGSGVLFWPKSKTAGNQSNDEFRIPEKGVRAP